LSIHLTKILSAVKEGQQKYCETVYTRSGIHHMWILKNSKDLIPEAMFKEVMHDLWLARISPLSNEVGLYVLLLEVLIFMPNSCETVYSHSGINHMWILKNSKDLLDNLKSRSLSQVSSILLLQTESLSGE
jgi:hypothetical protein